MGLFSRPRRPLAASRDGGARELRTRAAARRAVLQRGALRRAASTACETGCRVEALESRQLLAAQLVADLNLTSHAETKPPTNLVVSGGKAFFWGDRDLWVTDGTAAGTRPLPAHVYYPTGFSSA